MGVSFDFKAPCARHDFGWRNLKRLDQHWNCATAGVNNPCAPNGTGRASGAYNTYDNCHLASDKFASDMGDHCDTRSIIPKPTCKSTLFVYVAAVYAVT